MYQRLVRFSWNEDSISEREGAITSVCGLAKELTEIAFGQSNPGYAHEWNGDWNIPAELQDEWHWLEWAEDRIVELGHKIRFDDQEGKCVIELSGENFPLLLGYNSQMWLESNLKPRETK